MTKDQGPGTRDTARLRVLFINRMASMERGGGETFDLEIARHLARAGCEITFLSGIPVFGRSRRPIGLQVKKKDEEESFNLQPSTSAAPPPSGRLPLCGDAATFNLSSITLRAPMFPWFPWDRVKGGWRVRVAEFWLFEKLAARWAWKHRNKFDVIQACELPTFATSFKRLQVKEEGRLINLQPSTFNLQPKLVLRLTAPNVYDPSGGVQKADAVIASGTTVGKIRKMLRPDCEDVPNAVDVNRFQDEDRNRSPAVFPELHTNRKLVDLDNQRYLGGAHSNEIAGHNHSTTFNLQPSTCNLLYVARFQDFKRHDVLIRAFARVLEERPDSRLILVGGGPLERQVKQSVQCSVFRVAAQRQAATWRRSRRRGSVQKNLRPGYGLSRKKDKVMPSGVEASPAHRWLWRFLDFIPHSRDSARNDPKTGLPSNNRLSDAVSFLGEVAYETLPELYTAADIKVISSDYESFCFAALEAMASGLPIVTTDCGWVPVLIGDEFPPVEKQWYTGATDGAGRFEEDEPGRRLRRVPGGVIVGRNDPESLARAILELAQDRERRKACGAWNREKAVREHGWEASAKKLLEVYERVVREG